MNHLHHIWTKSINTIIFIQKYCFFYLHSETSYDTCGPRRDLTDVPRLFIVRYKRNATQDNVRVKKNVFETEEADPASQLVARYNGSNEIAQVQGLHSDFLPKVI